jgi:GNAT superfamily N-acetyltransferase
MNDRDSALRGDPAGEDSLAYHHALYEKGQHWFSAEHDGDEVGHAYVIQRQGPGSPHAEIKRLWTNPHYRGRGIGSQLLDNVAGHFKNHELRLKPHSTGRDGDPDEGELRAFYSNRGFADYQLKDGDPLDLYDYMVKPGPCGPQEKARQPAGRSEPRSLAAIPLYLHGGPNRVEPGGLIHQDAMPLSYGQSRHNYFTTSREVAEDAADMRDGLGHGWIHTVEPAGGFEVDRGEPESWKSEAPLRVISVQPGRLNGTAPHPPILRQQTAPAGSSASPRHLSDPAPYPGGFPPDERAHAGTTAAAPAAPGLATASFPAPPARPVTTPHHTSRESGPQVPRRARRR